MRLAHEAREATQRFDDWASASVEAIQNAGLVGLACFDPNHSREHLRAALGSRAGFDMVTAWQGLHLPVVQPRTRTRVDHFQYGIRCQSAYLARRRNVAGARLEAWVGGAAHYNMHLAELVAATYASMDESTENLCVASIDAVAAMFEAGGGGRFMASNFSELGIIPASGTTPDQLRAALAQLVPAEGTPLSNLLGKGAVKFWWTLFSKSEKAAAKAFPGIVSAVAMFSHRVQFSGRVSAARGAAVTSAIISETMFGRSETSGSVTVRSRSEARPVQQMEMLLSADEITAGPFSITRTNARVAGAEGELWTVTYNRSVRGGVMQGIDSATGFASGALLAVALIDKARSGRLQGKDGIDVAKVAVEVGKLVEIAEGLRGPQAARLGLALKRVAPVLDILGGTATIYAAATEQDRDGSQRFAAPDAMEVIGGVCVVMGGLIAGAALLPAVAASAAVVGTVVAMGAMMSVLGGFVMWSSDVAQAARRLDRDPLGPWLAGASVWGTSLVAPADVLALAKPDWDGAPVAPSNGLIRQQTDAFIKTAFTFPTGLAPEQTPGAVLLHLVPEYVPVSGLLLVSIVIEQPRAQPLPVRFTVRYEEAGRGFRYGVAAAGATADASLVATSVLVPRPGGAAPGGLATRQGLVVSLLDSAARGHGFRLDQGLDVPLPPGLDRLPPWPTAATRLGASTVRVAGLAAALGAGASVRGTVFFRPLDPGNTAVPDVGSEPRLTAFERFPRPS